MAEIVLAVVIAAVAGLAAGFVTLIALPRALEPNAPMGMVLVPLLIALGCFALAALLIFGG